MSSDDREHASIRAGLRKQGAKSLRGGLDPWVFTARGKPHTAEMRVAPDDLSSSRDRQPVITLNQLLDGYVAARPVSGLRHRNRRRRFLRRGDRNRRRGRDHDEDKQPHRRNHFTITTPLWAWPFTPLMWT